MGPTVQKEGVSNETKKNESSMTFASRLLKELENLEASAIPEERDRQMGWGEEGTK